MALSNEHWDELSLTEAAERLGVHYMTAYRYVRTGRLIAHKRAGQWWVTEQALEELDLSRAEVRPATTVSSPRRHAAMIERRLVVGDEAGSWAIVCEALGGGATPAEVHLEVISPAMVAIGAAWERGELTVAEEHLASATVSRILGRMTSKFRHPGRRKGRVILGSIAGDAHALPTAMLADLLADRGFEVIDLGANTPSESFIEVAKSVDEPAVFGLCCTTSEAIDQLAPTVAAIRSALPDATLMVGGNATDESALRLEIDGWAASGTDAVELFADLLD